MHNPEANLLRDAFQEFSKASDSIINYYNVLETQIKRLKEEVQQKNAELNRAKEYLNTVLNSLPVGVAVIENKTVVFANSKAEKLDSEGFLTNNHLNGHKSGELKNGRGYFRWKKEVLTNGFSGREVVVFEDVTEFEKMKERLNRNERLRAMGEMAARIAHEIKNPLGSMELFLSLLQKGKLRSKERKYIEYVQFGTRTVDRIINNLLSYTRPKTIVAKEEKLVDLVRETLDFMSVSVESRNIQASFVVSSDGTSWFDPDLMKLVVMNLISNAIEAVGENGHLGIEIREDEKHAVLVVRDSGCGMSDDVRKNIFNPFFSTKDKGVGLGLYIVYNIVSAHGGDIEVESNIGDGSSFFVYIPKEKQ